MWESAPKALEESMATQTPKQAPDATLGAIVAHPLRSRCLTLLAERTASPAEIAQDLEENLGNVSYHVKTLRKAGVIELVEEKPVRGAMEHFYRAIVRPMISNEETQALSVKERQSHVREAFSLVTANATDSLNSETFTQRPDHHISRVPLRVDESGWDELQELFERGLERIFEIQSASAERLGTGEDLGIPVVAFNTFFEMPERRAGGEQAE
jgi:DNA-binding transcriptional ArsR family regulator